MNHGRLSISASMRGRVAYFYAGAADVARMVGAWYDGDVIDSDFPMTTLTIPAWCEVQLFVGGIALFADEMHEQISLGVDAHDAPADSFVNNE